MQMPDNVKHIQLALLANSDDSNGSSSEEFHKILNSLPLEMVGNIIQIKASEMLVAPRISECFGLL